MAAHHSAFLLCCAHIDPEDNPSRHFRNSPLKLRISFRSPDFLFCVLLLWAQNLNLSYQTKYLQVENDSQLSILMIWLFLLLKHIIFYTKTFFTWSTGGNRNLFYLLFPVVLYQCSFWSMFWNSAGMLACWDNRRKVIPLLFIKLPMWFSKYIFLKMILHMLNEIALYNIL